MEEERDGVVSAVKEKGRKEKGVHCPLTHSIAPATPDLGMAWRVQAKFEANNNYAIC
jgi:hypothetical protein